ncbi:ammonium transporter [Candidatus Formimonas warabiya]|uniref:Ammonium transporter n=1 Tax=Formimonas warabiya TaxID=1761012 RepID=A0A3G1KXY3_FORW1|nr:ammonium transporter [Candidatus Formimonas warabiya]ATW27270.1 ammonium transporter [Candidatus Formimonas warabiya]
MVNTGDTAFVLLSAALVCLMTPGLAFFYGGLVRRKNVLTIMMQSFISMGVVTILWVICGFSLAFGPDVGGIIGNLKYAFLNGVGTAPQAPYGSTIPFLAFFSFQEMFAIITPALITGAFADRVNFKSYLIFLVVWSLLIYVPFAHWIWGGGFLAQLGAVDFAGGIVVHTSAGMAALASVFVVGKRIKKQGEDLGPHNVTYVALGTGLLWFGWFGFNAGSALAANGVASAAFVNTDIAGSLAMVTWLVLSWIQDKRPSFVGALTGAVAGLATITPAAGFVEPWAAAVIGLLSGSICYAAVQWRIRLDWDDALDVWGVHGVGGMLGTICVGIFASANVNGINGLFYGDTHQFLVQLLATLFAGGYAFGVTYAALKIINVFSPVRVGQKEETEGLDQMIHGESAYNF